MTHADLLNGRATETDYFAVSEGERGLTEPMTGNHTRNEQKFFAQKRESEATKDNRYASPKPTKTREWCAPVKRTHEVRDESPCTPTNPAKERETCVTFSPSAQF